MGGPFDRAANVGTCSSRTAKKAKALQRQEGGLEVASKPGQLALGDFRIEDATRDRPATFREAGGLA
jgi:hypothetical protein